MDCYSIENPFNDEVLYNIINRYQNKPDVYNIITNMNSDNKTHREEYVVSARDRVYKIIYNEWRNAILNPSDIRIKTISTDDLKTLQELLRNKSSVETEEEYNRFINSNSILEKYAWSNHGNNTAWTHINSNNIYTGQNKDWVTEHKLYINTDGVEDCVVDMFVSECIKKELPYYIKYSPNIPRDDMIVIYSDTKHLNSYINILEDIFKDNSWLDAHMCKPPVLTGVIDDYIGYGSEPTTKGESYHQKRAHIIEDAIKSNLYTWYLNHMDMFDVVLKEVIDETYDNAIKGVDANNLINQIKLGFVNYDITKEAPKRFDLKHDGKITTIYVDKIENAMRKYMMYIVQNDPSFFESIKKDILKNAKEKKVDNNFCFDVDRKESLIKTNNIK